MANQQDTLAGNAALVAAVSRLSTADRERFVANARILLWTELASRYFDELPRYRVLGDEPPPPRFPQVLLALAEIEGELCELLAATRTRPSAPGTAFEAPAGLR